MSPDVVFAAFAAALTRIAIGGATPIGATHVKFLYLENANNLPAVFGLAQTIGGVPAYIIWDKMGPGTAGTALGYLPINPEATAREIINSAGLNAGGMTIRVLYFG